MPDTPLGATRLPSVAANNRYVVLSCAGCKSLDERGRFLVHALHRPAESAFVRHRLPRADLGGTRTVRRATKDADSYTPGPRRHEGSCAHGWHYDQYSERFDSNHGLRQDVCYILCCSTSSSPLRARCVGAVQLRFRHPKGSGSRGEGGVGEIEDPLQ